MDRYLDRKSNKPIYITVVLTLTAIFALYYLFLKGPEVEHIQKVSNQLVDKQPSKSALQNVGQAVVILTGTSSPVFGTVTFEQATKDGPVTVSGTVQNLDPASLRGFHVHELGDLSNGCTSTGSHFNPSSKSHGGPTNVARHVGDLGNILSDDHGTATFSFTDNVISLNGPKSIVGRAVVVHEGEDDLGRGGYSDSLTTGHAGGRAACGVIGRV